MRRAYFNQTWTEDFTIMLIPVLLMVECNCRVVDSRISGVSAFANLVHNGRDLQSLMSGYLEITSLSIVRQAQELKYLYCLRGHIS
jgi:hypothetical protein